MKEFGDNNPKSFGSSEMKAGSPSCWFLYISVADFLTKQELRSNERALKKTGKGRNAHDGIGKNLP